MPNVKHLVFRLPGVFPFPQEKLVSVPPLSKVRLEKYISIDAGEVFALTGFQKMGLKAKVVKPSQRTTSLPIATVKPRPGPNKEVVDESTTIVHFIPSQTLT